MLIDLLRVGNFVSLYVFLLICRRFICGSHGAAGTSSMFSHYFDLIIKLKVSKSISSAIFNGMNITNFSAL
jgi:hypothetical protein